MSNELPDYVPPAGWRILRDNEPLGPDAAFSHMLSGGEWPAGHGHLLSMGIEPDGRSNEQLREVYMSNGGYILTPFTPTDTEREILPEELPQPAPSYTFTRDHVGPMVHFDTVEEAIAAFAPGDAKLDQLAVEMLQSYIAAACGGTLAAPADDLPTRTPLTPTDRLFPEAEALLPGDVLMAGGKVASSKCPPYHLIPRAALEMLANQCGLGVKRKGSKAWNALSDNQDVLLNREFVLERISHGINHLLNSRDRILNNDFSDMETENDMAAVFWCGMFLCSAADAMMKQKAGE